MSSDSANQITSTDAQSLVVSSCCNKRGETVTSSSSSSPEQSNFCLNDLPVHLIQEVLLRLPTTKSAFLCKCVCKEWYSLISSSHFAHRFITHHFNYRYKQNPSAVFVNYFIESSVYELFTLSDEPMFKSLTFKRNYLPEPSTPFVVVASFNDMMLLGIGSMRTRKLRYCICNPFTMDWVVIPVLEFEKDETCRDIGFVCEPYYFEDSQGERTINPEFRFRIVILAKVGTQFVVKTYTSETQQWHRSVDEDLEYLVDTEVVAYNGKLLWYNGSAIFAYDPFNPELSTFVDFPFTYGFDHCMGVCQGFLRFMHFGLSDVWSFFIWELKDYTTSEWSLEVMVGVDEMIVESSSGQKIVDGWKETLTTLSFHPSDKDVVFLNVDAIVISFNCQSRELKLVGGVRCMSPRSGLRRAFCAELPLWPTPIRRMD